MPTATPTLEPSAAPSPFPTASPTALTASPTPAPSPAPAVDTPDYSVIARDVVFLDEMPIQLHGQHTPGYIAFEAHTALMTPQQCFEACRAVAHPLRFFNLYTRTTDGKQVCSCVETFTGVRSQPGALVHGVCLAEEDLGAQVKLQREHILPGSRFRLKINLAAGKEAAPRGSSVDVTVRFTLPSEVAYVGSKALPPLRSEVTRDKVGPALNGSVLTWDRVPMAPKRKLQLTVYLRARPDAQPGTRLQFGATVSLRPPVRGLASYCAKPARNNATIVVVGKRNVRHGYP